MGTFDGAVDPTDADQAGEWNGADGEYWATYHQEYERLLGVFDDTLVEAGAVSADDRCLDVGCGTGATTRALAARAVDGSVLGVDLSWPMLSIARAATRALRNVDLVQADAQVYAFDPASFDVAVSRMAACSSATRSRRSATSAGRSAPADGSRSRCGRRLRPTWLVTARRSS